MRDFKKQSCAKCGEPFDEKSDIVVCPECGAPHHRECWKETGHCACEKMHADGYEWQPEKIYIGDINIPPEQVGAVSGTASDERVVCPNCGRKTKKSEKYCEFCGYYLFKAKDPFSGDDEINTEDSLEMLFDFNPAEQLDGVPAGDIKRFVGNMWIYYIPRFIKMSRGRMPVSFNFAAFLMHGFWFISRKMYLLGTLMIIAVAGISLFQAYFSSIFNTLSGNQLALVSMLSLFLSGLEFVIMIGSGLFGNRLYMRYSAKKVKKINAQVSAKNGDADEFNRLLEEKGGIAMLPVFSMLVCYMAILYICNRGFLF